ncbi:hypothetical protein ACJ2A9_17495 [Anaerobacillus sp. MEB173]|uniref:hypothetical protein n=1 Tax=Anaerobacillus sp. MEB173 TaxID=3383345 RepID=UPI003F919259
MKGIYKPKGKFLWDFWVYEENGEYHLFYLQAPLDPDPHTRHRNASIGHAISTDLIKWKEVGTALEASNIDDDWDSVSTWTGCTLKKDDTYYMFYTARCKQDVAEDGYVGHTQRIGVAFSKDLYTWKKYEDNPIVIADPRYYEQQDEAYNKHEGWRDPDVIFDEETGFYYMFLTARDKEGDPKARGCIGKARSKDLLNWEVLSPAASPRTLTDLEVPSLHKHEGKWYMIFAVKEQWYSEQYKQEIAPNEPQTGQLYFVSDSLDGEFKPIDHDNVLIGTADRQYTGRIIKGPDGYDYFLTWNAGEDEGYTDVEDPYTLAKPRKVIYEKSGKMRLE